MFLSSSPLVLSNRVSVVHFELLVFVFIFLIPCCHFRDTCDVRFVFTRCCLYAEWCLISSFIFVYVCVIWCPITNAVCFSWVHSRFSIVINLIAFTFLVHCEEVRYDFHIKTMFGSSLATPPPFQAACMTGDVFFVYVCIHWSLTKWVIWLMLFTSL